MEFFRTLSLFGTGRLNRVQFMRNFSLGCLATSFLLGIGVLISATIPAASEIQALDILLKILGTGSVAVFFVILTFAFVQRLHDLNRFGWWTLLTYVPGINILFFLYLVLGPGTVGPNRFGDEPTEVKHYIIVIIIFLLVTALLTAFFVRSLRECRHPEFLPTSQFCYD